MRKRYIVSAVCASACAVLAAGAVFIAPAASEERVSRVSVQEIQKKPQGAGEDVRGAAGEAKDARAGLSIEERMGSGLTRTAVYEAQGMTAKNDTVTVTADALRYRTSPAISDGNIKGTVAGGTALIRLYEGNGWSVVKVGGGEYYVSSSYLRTSGQEDGTTGSADTAQKGPGQPASQKDSSQSSADASAGGQERTEIGLDPNYQYAGFSKINSGKAVLYRSTAQNRKGKVIGLNAGHGTSGGSSVKTLCHPDGSPKVTGGSTAAGATTATAVSGGMTFSDGTPEAKVTLRMAQILKDRLLAEGYDVLMIRDGDDVQLDNIARTVIANNNADCHISLHWDSTASNKGCFYMSVPGNASYRAMEPVASHWQDHNRLGEALVNGLRGAGNKIFSNGAMEMDLTQTSYSTIPSVDIELGDKASSHSDAALNQLADGLTAGINGFFGA